MNNISKMYLLHNIFIIEVTDWLAVSHTVKKTKRSRKKHLIRREVDTDNTGAVAFS